MADDQTPHSDVIDDAIRQAERQLEEKLNALHMSAMGTVDELAPQAPVDEPVSSAPISVPTPEPSGDVAVLRPTGGSAGTSSGGSVGGLRADWDDKPAQTDAAAWDEPPTPAGPTPSQRAPRHEPVASEAAWGTPAEPVRSVTPVSNAGRGTSGGSGPSGGSGSIEAVPTEEELQFWAHTRTALRNLQQMTDQLPTQLMNDVTDEVERIVRDELGPSTGTLRLLQQQMQQGLPKIAERLETSLAEELDAATAIVRQMQDELPPQLDRMAREVRTSVQDEINGLAADMRSSVQTDVGHLEQSVATNVTRMSQGLNDSMSRVEQGMSSVGDQVGRVERSLRGDLERVDAGLRGELTEPTELVRKLDDELPSRFDRLERTVVDQVSGSQRELSNVLAGLVDAGTATLARLTDVTRAQGEDRVRHAEDVEFLVDTMTTGWEGLTKAMAKLYSFNEQQMERIESLEKRLDTVGDIEQRVQDTTELMIKHIRELKPAPVVVTVNHPDAQVSNTTSGGYLVGDGATDTSPSVEKE